MTFIDFNFTLYYMAILLNIREGWPMNTGQIIFSQIIDYLPFYEFRKCVKRYNGDYRVKSFSCLDQFLCMAFAQLTYRESLRDIEACLRATQNKLYHMGIRGKILRNNLSNSNEKRDWRIYADFAQILIIIINNFFQDENIEKFLIFVKTKIQ